MTEQRLMGWLCFLHLQIESDCLNAFIPTVVSRALSERGLIKVADGPDWDGFTPMHITPAGRELVWAHGAAWGLFDRAPLPPPT